MFCILSVVSLSLSLRMTCLRAQICNADVVCSLFVKRAPEKGMDNQPQAKLGLYTPLSAIELKTGGQTSEINPLIFLKICILGESDVTELDGPSFSRKKKKDFNKEGKKREKVKKKERN